MKCSFGSFIICNGVDLLKSPSKTCNTRTGVYAKSNYKNVLIAKTFGNILFYGLFFSSCSITDYVYCKCVINVSAWHINMVCCKLAIRCLLIRELNVHCNLSVTAHLKSLYVEKMNAQHIRIHHKTHFGLPATFVLPLAFESVCKVLAYMKHSG